MLFRPIGQHKNAFDATDTNGETFYFTTSESGNQIVKNKLTIRNQLTNEVVYENTVTTFQYQQTVYPPNNLVNGEYYNFTFITYDVNGDESEESRPIAFYCFSRPTVAFTNIPISNVITSSSYSFNFTYEQDENEPLEFLLFNLYDSSHKLIKTSNRIFYKSTNDFSYEVEGFLNNNTYYIEVTGVTIHGTEFYSDLEAITVEYEKPLLYSKLFLYNKCDEGYIQIQTNLIEVDGITSPENPVYVDNNTKLSMLNASDFLKWQQGYEITENFIIEIWGSPSRIDEFFRMWNENNDTIKIKFVRNIPYNDTQVKDYFVLSAVENGEEKVYAHSNYVLPINNTTNYVAWIKKVNSVWELSLDILNQTPNKISWNEQSNVEYNRVTNLFWENEDNIQSEDFVQKFENIDDMFPIHNTELKNGIYDHINITKDTSKQYTIEKPEWDFNTMLDCNFNGNVNGGNMEITLEQLTSIKIKRRAKNSLNWITLKEIITETPQDLNIQLQDYALPSNTEFEYAIVPILQGGIEGAYIISEITPQWNGVFISDGNKIFKLYNGVTYGGATNNKQIGVLQPLGSKYPYVIQNGNTKYVSGSVSGNIFGYEFEKTKRINRADAVIQTNDLIELLSSNKAICITDWNGNIWIGRVSSSDQIAYNQSYGNGFTTVTFNFVEQGKYDNQEDLYENGLSDVRI